MYENDNRIVMTLDAGGTNFVFTAIQGCKEIVKPIRIDAVNDDIMKCLETLADGFRQVEALLPEKPVAISFAFPGPADYRHGVIGDLPNFPCFRGGVAMGPYLQEVFGIPVYINNDGNLFAYGEALTGALPEINARLMEAGSSKSYRNLVGITLGTGFGGGSVIDNELLLGDNGCGGDVWMMRNKKYQDMIEEESVSARAVKRVYHENAPEDGRDLTPFDIFRIAEGETDGNREAAVRTFTEFGEMAGDGIAHAVDIVDGLIVIGGGLSGSYKYIFPAIMKELKSKLKTFSGLEFPALESEVFDLTTEEGMAEFLKDNSTVIPVPGTDKTVRYDNDRKIGLCRSKLGASTAISLGAYAFALSEIDKA